MTDEVAENSSAEARMRSGRQFGRDVLVNVLANLVAGAIIYMAGVFAGLLPRSPALLYASALLILAALGVLLFLAGLIMRGDRGLQTIDVAVAMFAIFMAGLMFLPGNRMDVIQRVAVLTISAIAVWSVVAVRNSRRNYRSKRQ